MRSAPIVDGLERVDEHGRSRLPIHERPDLRRREPADEDPQYGEVASEVPYREGSIVYELFREGEEPVAGPPRPVPRTSAKVGRIDLVEHLRDLLQVPRGQDLVGHGEEDGVLLVDMDPQ